MKTLSLKKVSIPKIAVLATGAAAALLAVTINPAPVAQAYPTPPASSCSGCHDAGGSVAATTPVTTLAAGAAYTVTLAFTGGSGDSAYAITGGATPVIGSAAAGATRTQAMTAPAVTTTYTVNMRQGVTASTTFTITIGGAGPTTPPVTTTTPPVTTTTPPAATTTTTTTAPPTIVPPTTDDTTGFEPTVAGAAAELPAAAVIPAGAPDTGAGGTSD